MNDKLQPLTIPRLRQQESSPAEAKPLVNFPVLGSQEELKKHVEDRAAELERMMVQLQDKAAMAEREAYNKAYKLGEQAGLELGKKKAEKILQQMIELKQKVEDDISGLSDVLEQNVLGLARVAVLKILGELDANTNQLLPLMIRRAIQECELINPRGKLRIALNINDLEKVRAILGQDYPELDHLIDADLPQGEARIYSDDGVTVVALKAVLNECFANIESALGQFDQVIDQQQR